MRFLYVTHHGQLAHLLATPAAELRAELLDVYGIGPETADSIVLYAAGQPVFVIDAYTRRIAGRLGVAPAEIAYDELQRRFVEQLPKDAALFNEYHALLVAPRQRILQKESTGLCGVPAPESLRGQAAPSPIGRLRRRRGRPDGLGQLVALRLLCYNIACYIFRIEELE